MAAVDLHEVDKAIYSAFKNDSTVTSLLGANPRIRFYIEPNIAFPFVRVDHLATAPWTATMKAAGADWVRRLRYQFNAFSQETSLDEVSAIVKALEDVLEGIPSNGNAIITGGATFGSAVMDFAFTDFDPELGSSYGVVQYTFSFD